jgi:acyl-CoA thioesterase-1
MNQYAHAYLLLPLLCLLMACGGTSEAEQAADTTEPDAEAPATPAPASGEPAIMILGNSLTAGYGLETVEDAFPGRIQARIDSLGLGYRVINAGISGETTTGGKNRLSWLLKQHIDFLVIELGANDGLRGIDPDQTRANLGQMIEMARQAYPEVRIILCGMMAPPNMGQAFTQRYRSLFPEIAQTYAVALVPFLLEQVAGEPQLNQADGIHPTVEGHQILANNLWRVLGPMITPQE